MLRGNASLPFWVDDNNPGGQGDTIRSDASGQRADIFLARVISILRGNVRQCGEMLGVNVS